MQLKNLTPQNIQIEVVVNGRDTKIFNYTNVYALFVTFGKSVDRDILVNQTFKLILVGKSNMGVSGGLSSLPSYDSITDEVTLGTKPTKSDYESFFEDMTSVAYQQIQLLPIGNTPLNSSLKISGGNVFIENTLPKNYEFPYDGKVYNFEFDYNASYGTNPLFNYDTQQVSIQGPLLELPKSIEIKKGKFVHKFYISGGVLGKKSNYSITEVIENEDNEIVSWITSKASTLSIARNLGGYWSIPQTQDNLSTSFETIKNNIKDENGLNSIQMWLNSAPSIILDHKPFYVDKNGSQFNGTQYRILFIDTLPLNAEDVNNTWAHVQKMSTAETDANNEVLVLYGDPPISETPDEQTREDIKNKGNNSKDNSSSKGSSSDLHYGTDDGSITNSITKLYELTDVQLTTFAAELWSQSYESVLKIQDNPIENVISLKKFPFAIGGTSDNIRVGNVTFGANAKVISKGVYEVTFPSQKFGGRYGNFLDYSPFTKCKIVLPYCGEYELPIDEIMETQVGVKYYIDLVHGDCTATVLVDNYPLYEFHGTMGINIPLTQTDRKDAEVRHATNIASGITSAVASGASGDVIGAISGGVSALTSGLTCYNSQHLASGSGGINMRIPQDIRIIITRPQTLAYTIDNEKKIYKTYPTRYGHDHGYPLFENRRIGSMSGFIKCGNNIDTSGIMANETIKNKIITMLQGGVYV